jgi:hypothetical protein
MVVTVDESEEGRMTAAWIESKTNQPALRTARVLVREGNKWQFVNIPQDGPGDVETSYVWGRIQQQGGQALIWFPSVEACRKAVEDGKLQGRMKKRSVILTGTTSNMTAVLESDEGVSLLNWAAPIVLWRLSGSP